jgi:hypothetical protein
MSDQATDLQLILRGQEQMIQEHATFRDDMRVMSAMLMRMDNTLAALLVEVRAMHARHDRLAQRVERIEAKIT